jgi:hypothetical protein
VKYSIKIITSVLKTGKELLRTLKSNIAFENVSTAKKIIIVYDTSYAKSVQKTDIFVEIYMTIE